MIARGKREHKLLGARTRASERERVPVALLGMFESIQSCRRAPRESTPTLIGSFSRGMAKVRSTAGRSFLPFLPLKANYRCSCTFRVFSM